jgi:cysteine synthase A
LRNFSGGKVIFYSITEIIGKTPLLKLKSGVFAKLEYFNPAGSVKDRAVLFMLKAAKERGELDADTTVIEPTSGNTGIAVAAICAANGIRSVIVMPDSFSIERRKILAAYGAEIVLTDGSKGMSEAIEKARNLQKSTKNSLILGQFDNPANPLAHYKTTAPEIWQDTRGKIDIFVAGVGTGGTVSGVGRFLKEKNPEIKIVAIEPQSSPVLSGGKSGAHKIQGLGAGFVPKNLDLSVIDEVVKVSDEAAITAAKRLSEEEGLFVGISSGAAYSAATSLLNRAENAGKKIVTLFPDGGAKYLSTL